MDLLDGSAVIYCWIAWKNPLKGTEGDGIIESEELTMSGHITAAHRKAVGGQSLDIMAGKVSGNDVTEGMG